MDESSNRVPNAIGDWKSHVLGKEAKRYHVISVIFPTVWSLLNNYILFEVTRFVR
jgi:hypothetical protein